jgi:hypothetical protein
MEDDAKLRDSEIALMDALKTVFEVLVAKQVTPIEAIAGMLRRQREVYHEEPPMPGALFVMDSLLEFLTDPRRAEARKLERDPPQGSA